MSTRSSITDAPVDSDAAALAGTTRSPIVDPGGVTFVYHGAADAVNLRCWIHGLPATQPFERVGDGDLWVLRVELPENSRIEYKFEVVRDGREDWILDPLNPLQAADPFGANSVAQGHGYERPEWTLTDAAAVADGTITSGTWNLTPDLAKAARVTIERRIGRRDWEDVEWSRANLINFYARLGDAEEALGIITPFASLHVALAGQERGRLGEEDPEGTQGGIADGVLAILASALVRQVLAGCDQNRQQLPPR